MEIRLAEIKCVVRFCFKTYGQSPSVRSNFTNLFILLLENKDLTIFTLVYVLCSFIEFCVLRDWNFDSYYCICKSFLMVKLRGLFVLRTAGDRKHFECALKIDTVGAFRWIKVLNFGTKMLTISLYLK